MTRGASSRTIFFRVLSVALTGVLVSACGPGQLLTQKVTPSPTSTAAPTATSTPSPTPTPPPTGVTAQAQPDGSTLVTDYDYGYQLTLGADWHAFLAGPDGWSSALKNVPYGAAEAASLSSDAEKSEPGTYRLLALDFAPAYIKGGHFPMLQVIVAPSTPDSCMPLDIRVKLDERAANNAGMKATFASSINSHGLEIGRFHYPEVSLHVYRGHGEVALFNTALKTMGVEVDAPEAFGPQAVSEMDALVETIGLLPSSASPTPGAPLLQAAPGGGTLVGDRELGYQFTVDPTWQPIVVTQDNAECLSTWVIGQGTFAFSPSLDPLVVLSHDPKAIEFQVAQGYGVHLLVGMVPDYKKGTPMEAFLASQKQAVPGIVESHVAVNSHGVEIGTIELTGTQTETQGTDLSKMTFTHLAVRGEVAHFRVGDQMLYLALSAPDTLEKNFVAAFESIVDSIEVLKP